MVVSLPDWFSVHTRLQIQKKDWYCLCNSPLLVNIIIRVTFIFILTTSTTTTVIKRRVFLFLVGYLVDSLDTFSVACKTSTIWHSLCARSLNNFLSPSSSCQYYTFVPKKVYCKIKCCFITTPKTQSCRLSINDLSKISEHN